MVIKVLKSLQIFLLSIPYCRTTSSQIESSSNNNLRIIPSSPEHVGFAHGHVIHKLQQSFEQKRPENALEYLHAVSIEMRKMSCDPYDPVCNSKIVRRTIEIEPGQLGEFDNSLEHTLAMLPENFDREVVTSIEDLYISSSLAKVEDTSMVLNYMNYKMDELKFNEKITNENDRLVGLIAFSVGMESTKQWAEVLRDPENPFYSIMDGSGGHGRKLQLLDESDPLFEIQFIDMLQADISGAISGAIAGLGSPISEGTMMAQAMEDASISSLKSFMINFISTSATSIISPECSFPGAFWCDENNLFTPSDDEPCLFPGSILCDENNNNTILPPIDPCIVPNNPFCPETTNTTGVTSTPQIPPAMLDPCSVPNNPFCPENNITIELPPIDPCRNPNNPLCNSSVTNLPPLSDLDPCILTPNAPMCNNGSPNLEPAGCPFPGTPLCDQLDEIVDNVGDPCDLYPNLPVCKIKGGTNVADENTEMKENDNQISNGLGDKTDSDIDMDLLVPGDDNSLNGFDEKENSLCANFPTLPSCQKSDNVVISTNESNNIDGDQETSMEEIHANENIIESGTFESIEDESIIVEDEGNSDHLGFDQEENKDTINIINGIGEEQDDGEENKSNNFDTNENSEEFETAFNDETANNDEEVEESYEEDSAVDIKPESPELAESFQSSLCDRFPNSIGCAEDNDYSYPLNSSISKPGDINNERPFPIPIVSNNATSPLGESGNSLIEGVLSNATDTVGTIGSANIIGNVLNSTVGALGESSSLFESVLSGNLGGTESSNTVRPVNESLENSDNIVNNELDTNNALEDAENPVVNMNENNNAAEGAEMSGIQFDFCDRFPNSPVCSENSGPGESLKPPISNTDNFNDEIGQQSIPTSFSFNNGTSPLSESSNNLIEGVLGNATDMVEAIGGAAILENVLNNATSALGDSSLFESVFTGNLGGISSTNPSGSGTKPTVQKPCFFGLCLGKTSTTESSEKPGN